MPDPFGPRTADSAAEALYKGAIGAGVIAALIGAFHLASWLSGVRAARAVDSYTITTNSSLCLLLCGVSLALAPRPGAGKARTWSGRILAGLAAAIGVLTLCEYLLGVDLGVDQFLAEDPGAALRTFPPNRMAFASALGFSLCGAGILLLYARRRLPYLIHSIAIPLCFISLLGFLGHLYRPYGPDTVPLSTDMSLSTASTLLILGIGLLLSTPREAAMATITSTGPGGMLTRRLLFPAVILPILLGWLHLEGEHLGLYRQDLGTSILVLTLMVTFSFLAYQLGSKTEVRQRADEERHAREALRESEQRLSSIIDHLAEGVIVFGADGKSQHWNRKALELHQYHADLSEGGMQALTEEYEIRTLKGELVPLEQWPILRILQGEELHDVELAVRDLRHGTERIFQYSGLLIPGSEGEPLMGLLNLRDITAKKEAEATVRESEEKFRAVFQQAAVGMGRVNFDDARWVDVNDAFCNMLGYSHDEMRDIPWPEMTHPEDLDLDLIPFRKMAAGELENYTVEKRFIHREGRHVWARLTLSLVRDLHGEPDYEVAIIEDISDRKQAEEALRKAKDELELRVRERTRELEEAYSALKRETEERLAAVEDLREKEQLLVRQSRLAAMGEMLGNIAHQWRQPLNVLGLLIQSLRFIQQKGLLTAETLAEEIARGMKVIQHMSQTIDDFKDFLKEEKESKEFSLNSAVAATIALLEAPLKTANISVEIEESHQLSVTGHRNEFSHVILNLVNNARDALKEKEVPDPKIVIRLFKEGEKSVITVADNAGGIPEEIVGRIFDPYFSTKAPDKGTGIGLYMSKSIIEKKMHGRLSVRNTAEGAEFRIEL